MLSIDYEEPAQAVGFVMGHNMLDAYWDNDGHGATRQDHDRGRNGATPRQDISSRLHGPTLNLMEPVPYRWLPGFVNKMLLKHERLPTALASHGVDWVLTSYIL